MNRYVIFHKEILDKLIWELESKVSGIDDVHKEELRKMVIEISIHLNALYLAERDVKMEVIKNSDYLCPKCHYSVLDVVECDDFEDAYKSEYCHNCGQHLNWDYSTD